MTDTKYIGKTYTKYIGKQIQKAFIDDNSLIIEFTDGTKIRIYDNGQSCCEHRYMSSDDDFSNIINGNLIHIIEKLVKDIDDPSGEYHEIQFVEVATDKGFITIANHNEHNGYYGGFLIIIEDVE